MPRRAGSSVSANAQNASEAPAANVSKSAPAAPAGPAVPHGLLEEAGVTSTPHGLALADSFAFRQHVNKALEGDGAADELVGALADAWADPDALRASLVPMHAPAGGRAAGFGAEAVKDSLVRLLLHVDPLQAGVAKALLEMLPALQAELEPESAHGGMPLPKLLLSQFRWLERVVDGEALLDAVGEMLQVVDPPLKRELVAIVPDLVQDAQHKRAVEVLTEVMEEDTAFTAPVLDALGSLVLEPRALAEVCTTVTDHVPSADVADLPVVIRFLLHHMTPAKGAGGGRGRPPKKAAAADDDDDDDDDAAAAAGNAAAIVSALRVGLKGLVRPVAPAAAAADAAERKRCEGETLVLDAIQSALRLRKELGPIVVGELAAVGARDAASEHVPIDWWLICALYSTALAPDRKKLVKVVKDKAATKGLAPALLRAAVVGRRAALRPHLGAQLELATALVKAPAPAARLLGASCTASSSASSTSTASARSFSRSSSRTRGRAARPRSTRRSTRSSTSPPTTPPPSPPSRRS